MISDFAQSLAEGMIDLDINTDGAELYEQYLRGERERKEHHEREAFKAAHEAIWSEDEASVRHQE